MSYKKEHGRTEYKVLINVNIFLVLNKNCTKPYRVRHKEATIFILIESSFNFLSVKSPREFSSLKQYQYTEGFQRLHTGVKARCAASLFSQFLRFDYLHYDIMFVFQTRK